MDEHYQHGIDRATTYWKITNTGTSEYWTIPVFKKINVVLKLNGWYSSHGSISRLEIERSDVNNSISGPEIEWLAMDHCITGPEMEWSMNPLKTRSQFFQYLNGSIIWRFTVLMNFKGKS
jgi:hypothetical protein